MRQASPGALLVANGFRDVRARARGVAVRYTVSVVVFCAVCIVLAAVIFRWLLAIMRCGLKVRLAISRKEKRAMNT